MLYEMDTNEYIKCRLNSQISWYSKKATTHKWIYHTIAASIGVIGVSITVVVAADGEGLSIAILGGVISALTVIQALTKSHEKWLGYRSACEDLKREKYYFKTASGHYSNLKGEDILSALVDRSESIIASEHQEWRSSNRTRNVDPAQQQR